MAYCMQQVVTHFVVVFCGLCGKTLALIIGDSSLNHQSKHPLPPTLASIPMDECQLLIASLSIISLSHNSRLSAKTIFVRLKFY